MNRLTSTLCLLSIILIFSSTLPLLAQRPTIFDSLLVTHSDTLYFASGSWQLPAKADSLLANYKPQATAKIYLTGHTDNIGSTTFNEQLAYKRATAAFDSLRALGWEEEQLHIQTFGERQPRNSNQSEDQRRKNRRVTLDLYQPKPYRILPVRVLEDSTRRPVAGARVRFHNRSLSDTLTTDSHGQLQIRMPVDSVVGADTYAKGYFYDSKIFKVKATCPGVLIIYLGKAQAGATADIANLYFVPSKAVLLPQSRSEPEKVLRFMQVNPNLNIEIAGHVNYPNHPPVTKNTFEWDLSVRRAKFLHDWLIEHGIDVTRLSYQGYGNHEMRFPRARDEEEAQQNRRVEIRVLE